MQPTLLTLYISTRYILKTQKYQFLSVGFQDER